MRFNEQETVSSVLQNIAVILSTPKGTVPQYRDFGLDNSFVDKPRPGADRQRDRLAAALNIPELHDLGNRIHTQIRREQNIEGDLVGVKPGELGDLYLPVLDGDGFILGEIGELGKLKQWTDQ